MKHKLLLLITISILFSFSGVNISLAMLDDGPEPEGNNLPQSQVVETSNDLTSFEKDSQYMIRPDAVPAVPAELEGKDKKEVSHNRDTGDWYENMEGCAVDY